MSWERQGDFSKKLADFNLRKLLFGPSMYSVIFSNFRNHLTLSFLIHTQVECSVQTTTLSDKDMGQMLHMIDLFYDFSSV